MPISLRLPPEIEAQIASFGARAGLSKSAVIVRSIQEYLARHAQPSSQQIYNEVMQGAPGSGGDAVVDGDKENLEQRPHKRQMRQALRAKHAQRSANAAKAP